MDGDTGPQNPDPYPNRIGFNWHSFGEPVMISPFSCTFYPDFFVFSFIIFMFLCLDQLVKRIPDSVPVLAKFADGTSFSLSYKADCIRAS